MKMKCITCGYEGEPTWRDQKYYCPFCNMEIPESQLTVEKEPDKTYTEKVSAPIVKATCPICRNSDGNTLEDGECKCSLCGTVFDIEAAGADPGYSSASGSFQSTAGDSPEARYFKQATAMSGSSSNRRNALEEEKGKRLLWGCIFLVVFWPIAIYHFYKLYQITKEL